MSSYAFPSTVYDQSENLLAVLGSWWADMYAGRQQISDLVTAKAQIENQSLLDLLELLASLSRFTVPIYHTANWYPLYLFASQRNQVSGTSLRYDTTLKYDDGVQYDAVTASPFYAFPCPATLADAPLILNRFVAPTMTQTVGVDYVLQDGAIVFRTDPFSDPRIAKRAVYKNGRVVDTEAIVWIYRGQFDWDTTYRQFAYVIGLRLKSSSGYRDLMNAIYDAMVGGPTQISTMLALSAMTGIPLVIEEKETIVDTVDDGRTLMIITDQHVYKFGRNAVPVVQTGQVVKRGQVLTDALQFHELNQGVVPTALHALALGPGFLSTCFYSDLVFENKNVPLVVNTNHQSGYTYVSWQLGGFPLDVQRFFDDMHMRGVAEASRPIDLCEPATKTIRYPAVDCDDIEILGRRATMAHLLDIRDNPVGEPTASMLPAVINPMKFLVENVLRNNAYIVRVKISGVGSTGIGLFNARILRKVIPPHTAMILVLDLPQLKHEVSVDLLAETTTIFTGMQPLSDTIDTVRDRRVSLNIVSGNCY